MISRYLKIICLRDDDDDDDDENKKERMMKIITMKIYLLVYN
jgi:hypothetical protein